MKNDKLKKRTQSKTWGKIGLGVHILTRLRTSLKKVKSKLPEVKSVGMLKN